MSEQASSYVTRHVSGIGAARRAVLYVMADMSNSAGRTRATLNTVSRVVQLCRRQVERHARGLREAGLIIRQGRTWVIVGVAGHDIATCEHDWCRKQHARRCRPKTTRTAWTRPPRSTPTMNVARPHGDRGDPGTAAGGVRVHETGPRRPSWRSKHKRRGRPP